MDWLNHQLGGDDAKDLYRVKPVQPPSRKASRIARTKSFVKFNSLWFWILLYFIFHFLLGIVFYSVWEGWTFTESLYFVIVLTSTVGYGDYHPSDHTSRLFTAFYILFGLSMFTVLLGLKFRSTTSQAKLLESHQLVEEMMCYDDGRNEQYRRKRRTRVYRLFVIQIAVLLLFVLVGGMIFSLSLGYTYGDGIYLAVVTGSSVGFGDMSPSHNQDGTRDYGMMWFSIFYILAFVTFVLQFAGWISTEVYNTMETRTIDSSMPEDLSAEMVKRCDLNGDKVVSRAEFLAAVLICNKVCNEPLVRMIFDRFDDLDVDNSGGLTIEDIQLARQEKFLEQNELLRQSLDETVEMELHDRDNANSNSVDSDDNSDGKDATANAQGYLSVNVNPDDNDNDN
eukprot:TRINITY_DN1101_c0_g1_i1.p1 TRINITY_DN1101_c0_g1~~TRINITY_DN1101_c0_g1_i1.p1  ORF type:complete len:395 (+),score=85.33 TRINITY_DN1101_c0_g1_i1:92-1276(+)